MSQSVASLLLRERFPFHLLSGGGHNCIACCDVGCRKGYFQHWAQSRHVHHRILSSNRDAREKSSVLIAVQNRHKLEMQVVST